MGEREGGERQGGRVSDRQTNRQALGREEEKQTEGQNQKGVESMLGNCAILRHNAPLTVLL